MSVVISWDVPTACSRFSWRSWGCNYSQLGRNTVTIQNMNGSACNDKHRVKSGVCVPGYEYWYYMSSTAQVTAIPNMNGSACVTVKIGSNREYVCQGVSSDTTRPQPLRSRQFPRGKSPPAGYLDTWQQPVTGRDEWHRDSRSSITTSTTEDPQVKHPTATEAGTFIITHRAFSRHIYHSRTKSTKPPTLRTCGFVSWQLDGLRTNIDTLIPSKARINHVSSEMTHFIREQSIFDMYSRYSLTVLHAAKTTSVS